MGCSTVQKAILNRQSLKTAVRLRVVLILYLKEKIGLTLKEGGGVSS